VDCRSHAPVVWSEARLLVGLLICNLTSTLAPLCSRLQRYPDAMLECLVRPLIRKVQAGFPEPAALTTGKENGGEGWMKPGVLVVNQTENPDDLVRFSLTWHAVISSHDGIFFHLSVLPSSFHAS